MKFKSALTLVELLLVIGLISILVLPALYAIPNIKQKQALETSVTSMTDNFKRARIYAREEKDQTGWGIRMTSFDTYYLTKGNKYSYTDVIKINTNPLVAISGVPRDIWFDQVTGETFIDETVVLTTPNGKSKVIVITKSGVIYYQ